MRGWTAPFAPLARTSTRLPSGFWNATCATPSTLPVDWKTWAPRFTWREKWANAQYWPLRVICLVALWIVASGTWHYGGHLIAGMDVTRTRATLPGGGFVAIETAGRLEYALSTRADVLAFVQYNNADRRADFNVRLHWTPVIGDDLFLLWNSGYTTDPGARFRFPSRQAMSYPLNGALVVKAVHRFAL